MVKRTIGVYKSYRNSGVRNHRMKTQKHWCHYFLEVDDYDEDDVSFGSEWVSSIKAMMLKRHIWKKKRFYCTDCENTWEVYVPAKQKEFECPECDDV